MTILRQRKCETVNTRHHSLRKGKRLGGPPILLHNGGATLDIRLWGAPSCNVVPYPSSLSTRIKAYPTLLTCTWLNTTHSISL